MSFFDMTPGGALLNAVEVAAKREHREEPRPATTLKSGGSGLLATAIARFKYALYLTSKRTHNAGLASKI